MSTAPTLANKQKASTARGLGLVLYGTEGIGKTGTALQFSNLGPLTCLSVGQTGFLDLEIVGEVPPNCVNIDIESWEDLLAQTKKIKEGILVIDALTGVQKILFEHVCRTVYKNVWDGKDGFSSYYKGQRVDSPPYLDSYLNYLDQLRSKGVHVVLLAHSITDAETNTLGADYLSHVIAMDEGPKGGLRACVKQWAQAILFMDIDIAINRATEKAADKTVMEGKALDRDNRLIYTCKSPGHSAKNRLQLPPMISMGSSAKEAFANLWAAMPKIYKDLL